MQDTRDDELLKRILDAHLGPTGAEPRICSYHKLRHRHSGRYHWVDFHIMVPAGLENRLGPVAVPQRHIGAIRLLRDPPPMAKAPGGARPGRLGAELGC